MIKGKKYGITAKNLLGHEMIGLKVKVAESSDKSRVGRCGVIVDETQNTFAIMEKEKIIVPKKECIFEFDLGGEKAVIDGKKIVKRPEDRAKDWKN